MSEEVKDIKTEQLTANQTSSYRSIFKATSLFGGVQGYTILIQVVKSKILAVLLGPLGIGIQGIYQSALDLIRQASSLGISQSAVRDVAEAHGSGNHERVNRTVSVLRRIVWVTGFLGLFLVVILSPVFSKVSFGSKDYIIPFILLSSILLLDQLSAGQKVVLQGTRRLKDLAKASAIGVTISLLLSLPMYYMWRVKGIVPALITTSLVTLFISWYYSRRVQINSVKLTPKEVFVEGKNMMVMGISMSLSGVMSMGVAYIIRSLLRQWGGTEEVGLFQAGFVIINSYVGLVFNAISTDYYPRLAAVNNENKKCRDVVSKQGEISVFLLAPLLSICIVTMPIIIRLLYSDQFLPANGFIMWACLGMMFRLASWLVSFMFIAKADSKLFIINELIANINYLWLSLVGYKFGGLTGMGLAFAVQYIVYFFQVYFITHRRYQFCFSTLFLKSFVLQLALVSMTFLCVLIVPGYLKYVLASIGMIISVFYGMVGLNNRIELFSTIKSKLHK